MNARRCGRAWGSGRDGYRTTTLSICCTAGITLLWFAAYVRIKDMSTMQYQVLVRSQSGDLFTASILGIADCVAEGRTREEAIAGAKRALATRLARGEIVTIELDTRQVTGDVWKDQAGRFRDDPTFDDFLAEMQRERRRADEPEPSS